MEPEITNGVITAYNITYNILTDTDIITVPVSADDRMVIINDLAPYTMYEISVVAITIIPGPAVTITVLTEQAGW